MKRIAFVLSLGIMATTLACAQERETDFSRLQKSYKDAIEKATKPINATYVTELRKLLEKQTRAGKLDQAKIIMEEIEAVTKEEEEGAITGGASDKEFEKFVIGTTWRHVAGSTVTFRKMGEGVKEEGRQSWPIVWRVHPPNIVEATGNFNPDGSRRTFFYRIISKKEAYYGDTADSATMPLIYVR